MALWLAKKENGSLFFFVDVATHIVHVIQESVTKIIQPPHKALQKKNCFLYL